MSEPESHMLYLSSGDMSRLEIQTGEVVTALEEAFRLDAAGRMLRAPKTSLWIGPGEGFQSLARCRHGTYVGGLEVDWPRPPGLPRRRRT